MPVDRLRRRQEIIDIIKVLCNDTGKTDLLVDMEDKVKALTCDDRVGNGASMLEKWDEENVDPFLIAGFIYANLNKDAANIKGCQRINGVGVVGDMADEYTGKFANVGGVDYRENARFMTPLGYPNAAKGLNAYLDNDLYKDTAWNLDWSKQLPLLKRFAVANSVFDRDFADESVAKNFYNNLSQLETGNCSTVSSIRKTLLAAASLKAGFNQAETRTILGNVEYDIDNKYTADRAEVFKGLYDSIIALGGGVTSETAIKRASIIFNSKKVSQEVVDVLKDNANNEREKFANAVVGVNGDTPEGRNKLAFAAALAADNTDVGDIQDYLTNANAVDIFKPENAKDFEYSLTRAQAFKQLYEKLLEGILAPTNEQKQAAIKKASIIFDSKKVSQDVVDVLGNAINVDQITKFKNAVAGMNIDINAPADRNKLAFAAALAADDGTDLNFITSAYRDAPDIFSPENAKDFEYSLTRAQAFKDLYAAITQPGGVAPETAIKKASIIFDSKKVSQDVVNELKGRAKVNKIEKFRDALDGVDIDINAPEDRNKLAFVAALAADNTDAGDIQSYLTNATNTFRPENAKDFEYSLTRAQAFKQLYEKLLEGILAPTNEQKQAAIKKASIIFDSKKVDQSVVGILNVPANNTQRTAFKNRVAAVNGDTPEDRNKLAFAADIAAQDFEKKLKELEVGDYDSTYSVRKTLVASALLKEGLTVKQSESVLDHLDSFFGSDDNKIALTPERLQAYASTMKAVIEEISISDQKKLNQVNDELLDLLKSNKIKDKSVVYFNTFAPDQKKSIVLKGYLKDACEELDKSTTAYNYNDLVKNIGERYKKQIDAFKDRLSERNDLDPSLKDLVLSDDFLKIDDVAKNLSKGQIESLEKLDSASFRSIVSLLNTVSRKESDRGYTIYNINAGDLTKYINTLFGQDNEVTSNTISKNFSNAFSKASEDIDTKVLTGNFYNDGSAINVYDAAGVNNYINGVCNGCNLGVDVKKDLRVFLQNMAHYDPSMLSTRDYKDTLVLFNTLSGGAEIEDFLDNYKRAVQNGVSRDTIANFYNTFNRINKNLSGQNKVLEDISNSAVDSAKKMNNMASFINTFAPLTKESLDTFNETFSDNITRQIKENKQADKELDESNAAEELKEKQKIENVKTVDEKLKIRLTSTPELEGAYTLHKSCLEDKDGQINDAYAVGLLAFTHTKGIKYDDTATILKNIYNKIKDEEDKKDILSNIVSSGGLIVYKDILKNNEFDLSLLRKMAVDLSNDEKITKVLEKTAQENLKGTLCEGKEGRPYKDRKTNADIGNEYEFTKTEWISYMAENASKIKGKDYEFADMNEEQKRAFKKACLFLSPKLLEQEAVCAAISQNIDTIKNDPEFFIHAINETYSKQNRKNKESKLETVTDIVDKTERQKGIILSKMTKEDFLELEGDAVWNVVKDNSYITKMVPYDAGVGAIGMPGDDEERECRRLYNRMVANSKDCTIFTDNGVKPHTTADGEIGYDGLKLNDYLSNCENLSQKKKAINEIISAQNNFEENFFTIPGGGSFYDRKGYAEAIFDDVSNNNHLGITLKANGAALPYKELVENQFLWKDLARGSLLVPNDKLDSRTESLLIKKVARLEEKDRNVALDYLARITENYKDEKDTESRNIFLRHVANELSQISSPSPLDFKRVALKAILKAKGISENDQNLLFNNDKRASFFMDNCEMFVRMDKEEFDQIFKKSQDPVENGKVIDKMVAMAEKYGGKEPKTREFVIRSAAYLSAESVMDHFDDCMKLQFAYYPNIFMRDEKYKNTYSTSTDKYERELVLEKAKCMNLIFAADNHYMERIDYFKVDEVYVEIAACLKDIKSAKAMKTINKELALFTNTTKTGKKNDKMLNTREDIYRFIETRKKSSVLKPLDNFSNDDLTKSINHFVYDGKDRESAEKFAKALTEHVQNKRAAVVPPAVYYKDVVEGDLLTAGTGFLVNNPQYKTINNAYIAETNPLKKRELGKQLETLIDLAKIYVLYDDEPKKLTPTLGNGMSLVVHDYLYDSKCNKIKTNVDTRRGTILVTAGNSSTYALTDIYDIKGEVVLQSLSGIDEDTYLKNNSKTYEEIATAIDGQHKDAKTKKVQPIKASGNREITHDELYKIEGLETFLAYTYSRARARALAAGMTEIEADFRAVAMTKAMDRKILNDNDFRDKLKKQIEEEEKRKIDLLMLEHVKKKVGDIFTKATTKDAKGIIPKISVEVNGAAYTDSAVLYDILHETVDNKAKGVLDTTINELQDSITSHLKIMGMDGQFLNQETFERFIEKQKKKAKESLSDTRSQLEELCASQLDTIEKEFEDEKISRAQSVIAITSLSSDYEYNSKCNTMVLNHASKLDNFSGDALQNFGIACNYIINDTTTTAAFKEAFENIESPQTLAKVSKLIVNGVKEKKDLFNDEEFKANFILLLATDSKTDALNKLVPKNTLYGEVLSNLSSGLKNLNQKQKTLILKKVNTVELNKFAEDLIEHKLVEPLELYDILENDNELKQHSHKALNKLDYSGNDNLGLYKAIEESKETNTVIGYIVSYIAYNENQGVTDNDIILYKKAGKTIVNLSDTGKDIGKEFASLINNYGEKDKDVDEKGIQEAKQKIAYAFVFANDYKEGAPGHERLAERYENLLDELDSDNKQYLFNALLEKECGKPNKDGDVTAEQFAKNIVTVDKMLNKDDKILFVNTVKQYMHRISGDSQKFSDIFTSLCESKEDNASLYIASLLDDQIELSKSSGKTEVQNAPFMAHTSYGVERNMPNAEEIISNAIKKISVGIDTPEKTEQTTNSFHVLVKNLSSEENKKMVMNGIMSYIESLDTIQEQTKLSVSLAKMFTKDIKTEEDRKLGDQFLTTMARNFAGNEDLFIEIINGLDNDKAVERDLQAELFYHYSKYADFTSTRSVYKNSMVKNNNILEAKYYKTLDGSYSRKTNRDISDILNDIGVNKKEDQELIIKQLKRCSSTKAVEEVLNGFIDEHNKQAEEEGRGKVDKINAQDIKKISKQIMVKRQDLLEGLISGDEKIFEGGSVMLDAVQKYAENMKYRHNGENNELKAELLSAVSKMKKREQAFKKKADTIRNCKDFNYKRALTAANFLSKMECANAIIADYKTKRNNGYYLTSGDRSRYESALARKKELLSQKYDFTESNRHWWNGNVFKRTWNSICKNTDYMMQGLLYPVGKIISFVIVQSFPLVLGIGAAIAAGTLIPGALASGILVAASIVGGIAGEIFWQYKGAKHINTGSNWCNNLSRFFNGKALKIKEEKLMEKAEATLKKSNHALAVLDGRRVEVLKIQNLTDEKTAKVFDVNSIDETNMELRSKRLRGIRGTRFAGINPFTGEDGIKHTFAKGTIRRTTGMNAAESFADMKLKKYDKDMTAIMKAFTNIKSAGLGEKSEAPQLSTLEKKNDNAATPTNKSKMPQVTR